MINEEQISKTVRHLYEAALKPDLWQTALLSVGNLLGSYGGSIMFWDFEKNIVPKLHSTIIPDENAQADYIQHYASFDPRALYLLDNPDAAVFSDRNIMSEEEMLQSEYGNWERNHTEMRYAFGARLTVYNGMSTVLSMARNSGAGHPDYEEEYIFRRLVPHVKRAVQIGEVIELQKLELDALFMAAEQNMRAVIILDQQGDVLHLNEGAKRIIKKGDSITLLGQNLTLLNPKDKARFDGIIADVLRGNILNSNGGGRMALTRKGGKLPYHVLITPLPQSDAFLAIRKPSVMIVLSDPVCNLLSAEFIHHQCQFTKREAEFAVCLMSGEDLAEIANRMKITPHTIQAYLKSMFLKTQTHSLTAMVSLLMKNKPFCTPVREL